MKFEINGTERLIARPLEHADLILMTAMHQDVALMETLGGVKSKADTEEWVDKNLSHWKQHGYGLWLFFDREAKDFVGRSGIRHVEVGGAEELELAYALVPAFWGKGLATEMAKAVTRAAFENLRISDLVAFTMTTNLASRRVMERVSFVYERDIVHHDLAHVLYRLRRDDWRAAE